MLPKVVSRPGEIRTIEEFLAHALTLETEAANSYQEVGDSLAVHNNPEVAELFFRFARYGHKHADEVRELAQGMELPHIAPWDFAWQDGQSPEMTNIDEVDYMMTPADALALALKSEKGAQAFYADVAASTVIPRIKELALMFAAEESEHVSILLEWVEKYPRTSGASLYDPDPPVMPE